VAATKYGEAAEIVKKRDKEAAWHFLMRQANELSTQAYEFGDQESLESAVSVYRRALRLVGKSRSPVHWATNQVELGNALQRLGRRAGQLQPHKDAIEGYRRG
jgi:hypothetical protein